MSESEKARESRLRRLAKRQGYALRKDRARSINVDHLGDFMIVEPNRNLIMAGQRYDLSLDDVEEWLKEEPSQ